MSQTLSLTHEWLGPAADFWELVRRVAMPLLDHFAQRFPAMDLYATYALDYNKVVGTIDADPKRGESAELCSVGSSTPPRPSSVS